MLHSIPHYSWTSGGVEEITRRMKEESNKSVDFDMETFLKEMAAADKRALRMVYDGL
jgi:hypothetical protein